MASLADDNDNYISHENLEHGNDSAEDEDEDSDSDEMDSQPTKPPSTTTSLKRPLLERFELDEYDGVAAKNHQPQKLLSPEEQARKKAKEAPLHKQYVAPLSFLLDAVQADPSDSDSFNITTVEAPFGRNKEAYVRSCYEEITKEILQLRRDKRKEVVRAMAFIIAGSSGIGKSTFLSYFVARSRKLFANIGIFYASKNAKSLFGTPRVEETRCVVFVDGQMVLDGKYANVSVEEYLPRLDLIVMDGCSMPFDLHAFDGTVLVAASPSLYVKNLLDAIFSHYTFIMPPLEDQEALVIGEMLGVEDSVVLQNLKYMNGVTRYLFEPNFAKQKVNEAAREVNATSITRMVSMQTSNRAENTVAVHSLVLWKTGNTFRDPPRFELVSRYAERLVAKKLLLETAERLKRTREYMAPLSGAEGYAGALFEAYAIRTIQRGGTFVARRLDDSKSATTMKIDIPTLTTEPIVVESNKLTESVVPYEDVRVLETGAANYSPRLLWPTTTNFPTFDCFYFHTDGRVFPLQMTIAMVHVLKNSGAANAKKYFDRMLKAAKPTVYPAVFVVPQDKVDQYKSQVFTGKGGKKEEDFGKHFEQWVIGV